VAVSVATAAAARAAEVLGSPPADGAKPLSKGAADAVERWGFQVPANIKRPPQPADGAKTPAPPRRVPPKKPKGDVPAFAAKLGLEPPDPGEPLTLPPPKASKPRATKPALSPEAVFDRLTGRAPAAAASQPPSSAKVEREPAPPAVTPGAEPAATGAAPGRTITLRGDRLTVQVSEVPLEEILQAVAAPSKAEIRGAVKEPRAVTVDFADVPLRDGLTRLLGEQNFLLTYREDGTLRSLTLLGGPLEPSAAATVVKTLPPAAPQPAAASPADLLHREVPVSGKLQQFVGQPTATMQQLMDITLRQEDPTLRMEAMRAGLNAIDSQPDMRAAVVNGLESTDDQGFENAVRAASPDRAREIVAQIAATSKTPEIRTRSLRLLRTLNETGSDGAEE
jgi:hypothetical protein